MKIGFDFGTSFSALAVYRDGEIHRIMFDGEPQFRTAIYFPPYAPSADFFNADDHQTEIASIRSALIRSETEAKENYSDRVREERVRVTSQARNDPAGYNADRQLSAKYQRMLSDAIIRIPEPVETTRADKDKQAIETARRQWLESEAGKDRVLGNLEESQLEGALFGNEAVDAYLNNDRKGLLLYNPKAFLAHDLSSRLSAPLERAIGSLFRKVVGAVEEQFQGEQVTGVVIGRPVNFGKKQSDVENDRAISIITHAAELAGMSNVSFMYEPSAASYQFHVSQDTPRKVLVVDLGGGTADLSLVTLGGAEPAPIPHRQQGYLLGGNDVDRELNKKGYMPFFGKGQEVRGIPALNSYFAYAANVQHIEYQKKFIEADLRLVPEPFRERLNHLKKSGNTIRLNRLAEESKIELGQKSRSRKVIDFIGEEHGVDIDGVIYADAMARYLEKLKVLLKEFSDEDFDMVSLTGGMSRAKGVKELVERVFPDKDVQSSESTLDVVSGLAIYAAQQ
ncbi:Hsp70 family protein [Alcanivorax borkumensis]|uniref:Hsp70 family protein n=1 Tax=Alcanivorax borkumensis TaxID=59754 RepID=UPI003562C306